MDNNNSVVIIIPALNEEAGIAGVLSRIPSSIVEEVIVVDNGSTDRTAEVARSHGAIVICERVKGYGRACKAGIREAGDADILVFMDGDNSDYPEDIYRLLEKIGEGNDLVIGSRERGVREKGSLKYHQRLGNRLIVMLVNRFWKFRYTDLGPLRAIRRQALEKLNMEDDNYGWTLEMQIKALKHGLKVCEVPVNYRNRTGRSKVSGTVTGSIRAAVKMMLTIFKLRFIKCT